MDTVSERKKRKIRRKCYNFPKLKFECDPEDNCLPFIFDLDDASLLIISTEEQLNDLNTFMCSGNICIIGIDTETRPSFISKHPTVNPTSIIQIAFRMLDGTERVYIVDLLHICNDSSNVHLSQLLDSMLTPIFSDANCIKVGQGLANDFQELTQSYPQLLCFRKLEGILETNVMLRYLKPEVVALRSLKHLVKDYLHCNLVKTQQVSDWAKRPLSQSQIHYAACDALVLLRLYDTMSCEVCFKVLVLLFTDFFCDNTYSMKPAIPFVYDFVAWV